MSMEANNQANLAGANAVGATAKTMALIGSSEAAETEQTEETSIFTDETEAVEQEEETSAAENETDETSVLGKILKVLSGCPPFTTPLEKIGEKIEDLISNDKDAEQTDETSAAENETDETTLLNKILKLFRGFPTVPSPLEKIVDLISDDKDAEDSE